MIPKYQKERIHVQDRAGETGELEAIATNTNMLHPAGNK